MATTATKLMGALEQLGVDKKMVADTLGVHLATVYRKIESDSFTLDELAAIHSRWLRAYPPDWYTDIPSAIYISYRVYGRDAWDYAREEAESMASDVIDVHR